MAACFAALLAACLATAATAAVRVVEDEVFFTLDAPGAREVYLVGDFNNWNATVEKMRKTGERFEISLFLVEGTYRYKFVVDGQWTVDPDNPGDPAKGSPLVLVERPAGMMLLTSEPEAEAAAPSLLPWLRYIGQSRWNAPGDRGYTGDHLVHLGVDLQREKLRGQAALQWSDARWERYGRSGDVTLDWGFVGTDVGGLSLDAFTDTDAAWTSIDPVTLVGEVGVFDYNAGYRRNGVAADYRLADALHLRGLYADDIGQLTAAQPGIPLGDLGAASSGADTTAYAVDLNAADSDVLGLEAYLDTRDFKGGVVTRRHYGRYPGTLAEVSFADSTAVVSDTRQDTDATFYWAGTPHLFGVGLALGYGRAHAEIHQLNRDVQPLDQPRDLVATQLAGEANVKRRFETSDRYYGALDVATGPATARAEWDRVTFEFNGVVFAASEATVDRVSVDFDWTEARWTAGLRARYTRPDYEDTPSALLVDSPALNMWLDWRDQFDVADIVGIGDEAYTDVVAVGSWYPAFLDDGADTTVAFRPRTWPESGRWPGVGRWTAPFARLEVGTTTHRFFDGARHNRARLTLVYVRQGRYYAMADGRVARYNVPGWGAAETFASGYLEAGYLYRWFNVNLGWGFDPVVFDPVVSDYMDIGRTQLLRGSLAGGVTRDGAAEIGKRLLSLERQLQGVQTIKLEVVLYF